MMVEKGALVPLDKEPLAGNPHLVKCCSCSRLVRSKLKTHAQVLEHMRQEHYLLRCAQCPKNFADEYALSRHYDRDHRLLNGPSVCPISCTTDLQNLTNNNAHLVGPKHVEQLDVECPTQECTKRFETHAAVMAHHAEEHEKEDRPQLRLELFRDQVGAMGFMMDYQDEVEEYCRLSKDKLSVDVLYSDLHSANEAVLLALENDVVVSHVHLKLLRHPATRAGWVLSRNAVNATDFAFWKLLEEAYRFVCAQRLLNFIVPVERTELHEMLAQ